MTVVPVVEDLFETGVGACSIVIVFVCSMSGLSDDK